MRRTSRILRQTTRFVAAVLCALLFAQSAWATTRPTGPAPTGVVRSQNDFGLEFYKRLAQDEKGNLFFSPYSAFSALLMAYAGAEGKTKAEMRKVLGRLAEDEQLRREFRQLLASLKAAKRDVELEIANGAWAQARTDKWGYPVDPLFIQQVKDAFGGEFSVLDFIGRTEESRKAINRWVERKTDGKIRGLLAPGTLDKSIRFVLANAIVFKGAWKARFEKSATEKKPFYTAPGNPLDVAMMFQENHFDYFESAKLQLIELPYKGERLSMVVLLPKKGVSLADVERELSATALESWLAGKSRNLVRLSLPRFKVATEISLIGYLKKLGMKLAFSQARAEFYGFLPANLRAIARASFRLFISGVLQKGQIEVGEEGTTAVVVTLVKVGCRGVCTTSKRFVPPPKIFNANRPFLYLVRDTKTGALLFVGRVNKPV